MEASWSTVTSKKKDARASYKTEDQHERNRKDLLALGGKKKPGGLRNTVKMKDRDMHKDETGMTRCMIYVYILVVCVCVCVERERERSSSRVWLPI